MLIFKFFNGNFLVICMFFLEKDIEIFKKGLGLKVMMKWEFSY